MGPGWTRLASPDGAALREAIWGGALLFLEPTAASHALVERARAVVAEELGPDPRAAHRQLDPGALFAATARARARLVEDPALRATTRALVESLGVDPSRTALDPPRLRGVPHDGARIPEAAPAYHAHRDTWYANPRAQLNWWLPLWDVEAAETVLFYPTAFGRAVANDSDRFDWDAWSRTVGWQRPGGAARGVYPRALAPLDSLSPVELAAPAGAIVLFSAAQLHQTRAHATGRVRWSVDFRTVDLDDHAAGRGAPDPDNRARGSALASYLPPDAWQSGA